ncbi:hypothetical protein SLEP1_g17246 [Rubroshorea leprosula]|uniref:Uncharacterized protein n=1 Tax=Rubroshorea leprosula TaxID=152421 RepID=A0AAV5ITM2_9ROSI|nr:hypothetical protein SLEP1_g17246 [Rubroshorea leprosula]
MNQTPSPPPSLASDGDIGMDGAWYGNIQYLLNISTIGLFCCVFIFVFLKLRSDHRRMPGPAALFSKLLAVCHATGRKIAVHCGADAAQFLLIEDSSFVMLLSVAFLLEEKKCSDRGEDWRMIGGREIDRRSTKRRSATIGEEKIGGRPFCSSVGSSYLGFAICFHCPELLMILDS